MGRDKPSLSGHKVQDAGEELHARKTSGRVGEFKAGTLA